MQKILFVVSFPKRLNSSARFRIELYEKALEEKQFDTCTEYFWSRRIYFILYEKGNILLKLYSLIIGFLKRLLLLTKVSKYDYIFILREATPIGPPFFEWICTKVLRKKIIYDFDDAIWISQASKNNSFAKIVKASWKVKFICKWAYKVSVGNPFLYNYAANYNNHCILNPTCVDTERGHNMVKRQSPMSKKLVIGWTGSFSTLIHLDYVVEALLELEKKYEFVFLVIADRNPNLPFTDFIFKQWKENSEIEDLLESDIGIMPLYDTEYTKGKCGFKLIQFMALGIPVVASPIGVNMDIVDVGVNGFLCHTKQEWMESLEKLILNNQLRIQMGINGREKIKKYYSEASNKDNFLALFS